MNIYISASVYSRSLEFVCHRFIRNFQVACHAIIFTIIGKASYGVASLLQKRGFITRVRKTIDCKSFLFLCNVDAKIDGNCYEGPTLISSTRYSFPFEKVVSINMTRYSATFSNNEFSFSRFFFSLSLELFIWRSSSVTYFLWYYYRNINIRMTEKDIINELENSVVISDIIVWYVWSSRRGKLSINYPS